MSIYLLGFTLALCISLFLTPVIKMIASNLGIVDSPDERKVHSEPIPRLGGLAIYAGFILSYILCDFFFDPPTTDIVLGLFIGSIFIILTGILDDKFQINPFTKIFGQILAVIPLLLFDIKINYIHIPFSDGIIDLGWLSIPITILWIVGITNAINLIDGLDGLAAGVSGISAFAMFLVSLTIGNYVVSFLSFILFGSIAGFLRYNFYPAKIFMGDTGSLFLGFSLATLSLLEMKQVALFSFLTPIFILGIPITDTIYAMIRRKINGKPIMKPDKKHLHHCLLDLGFSHKQTVFIIYGISALFSLLGFLITNVTLTVSIIIFIIFLILIQLMVEKLGMFSENQQPFLKLLKKIASIFTKS
jgi:UDP-GlcNAc:undecaprenyl-phosphate/decaprenyl-phosphate GlcNAc-1-phosphate transferase